MDDFGIDYAFLRNLFGGLLLLSYEDDLFRLLLEWLLLLYLLYFLSELLEDDRFPFDEGELLDLDLLLDYDILMNIRSEIIIYTN